jgi:hypothetical protein
MNEKTIRSHNSRSAYPSRDYESLSQFDAETPSREVSTAPVVPAVLQYGCRFVLIMICSFLAGHVPCFELVSALCV